MKMTDADMDDVMNVNFREIFLTSRAVARHPAIGSVIF